MKIQYMAIVCIESVILQRHLLKTIYNISNKTLETIWN